MKVIDAAKMRNKNFADKIIQETLFLSYLNHENIIKIKDFYKVKTGSFVSIIEYQECYDLNKIVTTFEQIMEKNKKFSDQCYEEYDG